MPYISNSGHPSGWTERKRLDPTGPDYGCRKGQANTVGELNFQVTRLCDTFIQRKGLSYETLNAVIGVLEAAKLELYRRIAAPYEDQKRGENGEVYESANT